MGSYFQSLREACRKASRIEAKAKKVHLTEDQQKAVHGRAIQNAENQVGNEAMIEGMNEPFRQQVRQELAGFISELIKAKLDIPLPEGTEERLLALSVEVLTRQVWGDFVGGVVIGGFGDDEYMPSIATFEVEESVAGKPRKTATSQERLQIGGVMARISPFAQRDSVYHFLLGVHSDLFDFMSKSVNKTVHGVVDLVLDKATESCPQVKDTPRAPIHTEVGATLQALSEEWWKQQGELLLPVLHTISVLPKDELASMAEAFVNLSKFRGRVTPAPETVSGPIDVAVITKGDGFVWIRRKHYFEPNLNPRVMARLHHPGGMS